MEEWEIKLHALLCPKVKATGTIKPDDVRSWELRHLFKDSQESGNEIFFKWSSHESKAFPRPTNESLFPRIWRMESKGL